MEPELSDLQCLEHFVSDNDDLFALEEQIGRFNAFDALNIARVEIRHSNFLSWLLTPTESHGQGDIFLKALLMGVLKNARRQGIQPPFTAIELDGTELVGVEVRREHHRIDLLIRCEQPRFLVAIENKIDAGEHSDQLQRYEQIVREKYPDYPPLFVFLTPEGEEASDEDWVTFSYAELHSIWMRVRRMNAGAIGGDVAVFLEHYLNLIGNRLMDNPDIDKLCRQIYTTHRRAIDLIIERVGSPSSSVIQTIESWMREQPDWVHITSKKSEIEFLPRSWDKLLPPVGQRKTFKPEHWMTLRLLVHNDQLILRVVVCPAKVPEIRKSLLEVLKSRPELGFRAIHKRSVLTDTWTRVLSETVCRLSEEEEEEPTSLIPVVQTRLAEFIKQTAPLADALRVLTTK